MRRQARVINDEGTPSAFIHIHFNGIFVLAR